MRGARKTTESEWGALCVGTPTRVAESSNAARNGAPLCAFSARAALFNVKWRGDEAPSLVEAVPLHNVLDCVLPVKMAPPRR